MKNFIWPNVLAMLILLVSSLPARLLTSSKPDLDPTPDRLYVDVLANGNGSGTSWDDALTDLQTALDQAGMGTEIWVAYGWYLPTQNSDRSASFHLKNGVKIYGGFLGYEASLDQRVKGLVPSTLSGDIGTILVSDDNSYHVVDGSGTDTSALLDGFTISDGAASDYAGGMLLLNGSPTLVDITFTNNRVTGPASRGAGAGLYNQGGSPSLRDVAFEQNSVSGVDVAQGGGMYSQGGSPKLINVSFRENTADSGFGGGLYIQDGNPSLFNLLFESNHATQGGGIYNSNVNTSLINPTLSKNSAVQGGGMYNESGTLQISNAIFWANTSAQGSQIYNLDASSTIQSSLIQDGCPAGITCLAPILDVDPQFVDPAEGDLRLTYSSPAIDAGDNAPLASTMTSDIGGHLRKVDVTSVPDSGNGTAPIVDLGAYETPPERIYVKKGATGSDSGLSWQDAFIELRDAMSWTIPGVEVWVASGVYTPNTSSSGMITFLLNSGVHIYGGFAGNETSLEQRDWMANETVLSGDLVGENDRIIWILNILTTSRANESGIFDGFTLTKSYESAIRNIGGSPTLRNLIVRDNLANEGAGMYNRDGNPNLTNILFYNNRASNPYGASGGGMYNENGSPRLTNVVFWANTLEAYGLQAYGAGMYSIGGSPVLTNVTFYANEIHNGDPLYSFGAGLYNYYGIPTLNNCIFWGNIAEANAQIYNINTQATIRNSLVQDSGGSGENWDPAIGVDGGGNIDADPQFLVSPDGMLQLSPFSVAIDAGDN
jgi:predicted outer membrane repeat protein